MGKRACKMGGLVVRGRVSRTVGLACKTDTATSRTRANHPPILCCTCPIRQPPRGFPEYVLNFKKKAPKKDAIESKYSINYIKQSTIAKSPSSTPPILVSRSSEPSMERLLFLSQ